MAQRSQDCFASGDAILSVEDAVAAITARFSPVDGIETVALSGPGADCADWVRELGDKVVPRLAEL